MASQKRTCRRTNGSVVNSWSVLTFFGLDAKELIFTDAAKGALSKHMEISTHAANNTIIFHALVNDVIVSGILA